METITKKLRGRFCRDYKLAIKVFDDPYFTDRLELFDKVNSILPKYDRFLRELRDFEDEQSYNEYYASVKDKALYFIKGSEGFNRFSNMSMSSFVIEHRNMPARDIYKPDNHLKDYISVDLRKANFNTLKYFDDSIFGGAKTWEEFISNFTDSEHIIESKYIRQVIFGNCESKKHIDYEKYITDMLLSLLDSKAGILERVDSFSNDEIIINVNDMALDEKLLLRRKLETIALDFIVPVRVELFRLYKISNIHGYIKREILEEGFGDVAFKGIDSVYTPFVYRKYLGEQVQESDKVFIQDGMLCKFLDIPKVVFDGYE